MARSAKSGFAKSTLAGTSGVYACRCCTRNTRQTGGDNDNITLCNECYELSGQENSLSDSGEFYGCGPQDILNQIAYLGTLKGANLAQWDYLKSQAEAMLAPAPVAPATTGKKLMTGTAAAFFVRNQGRGKSIYHVAQRALYTQAGECTLVAHAEQMGRHAAVALLTQAWGDAHYVQVELEGNIITFGI